MDVTDVTSAKELDPFAWKGSLHLHADFSTERQTSHDVKRLRTDENTPHITQQDELGQSPGFLKKTPSYCPPRPQAIHALSSPQASERAQVVLHQRIPTGGLLSVRDGRRRGSENGEEGG